MSDLLDRRAFLAGAAATLAGCGSEPGNREGETDQPDDGSPEPTATGTDGDAGGDGDAGTSQPGAGELDLREANVTDVDVERSGDDHRFAVTLYHDDDGEDGYANWWQVERRDGTRLGRRKLLHAHGTREFTRSDTFTLPEDAECVVVRGHDQTHGYGGRAMLVTLSTGATRGVRQGSDPRSFADADCPRRVYKNVDT